MNNPKDEQSTVTDTGENQHSPFVNEECGDTMWNVVLQEAEERLKKVVNQKQDTDTTKTLSQTGNNRDSGNKER